MPAPVRSTSIAAQVGAVELERGDVDAVARGVRLLGGEAQLAHQVAAQPGREEAHAIQCAERRAELGERVAGDDARVERRTACGEPRSSSPRSAASRPSGGCSSAARGPPPPPRRGRRSTARARAPTPARRAATGRAAGSKPRARAPIRAASSAAPSASSAARSRKSSSDDRVGSIHARMARASASKRHGCMLPPDGAELAHATMKRSSSRVGEAPPAAAASAAAPGALGAGASGRRRWQRRLPAVRGQLVEIGVEAPGAGEVAERDPPHGVGHHRPAERDVRRELRPRRDRLLDLDQRRRRAVREARRVEDADDVRDLLLGRQAAELRRRDVAEQPVEQRPAGLEVEALHVEHPAMARGHHARAGARRARARAAAPSSRGRRTRRRSRRRPRRTPRSSSPRPRAGNATTRTYGIELGDLARGQHDLAHADVGEAARHPVQVRELQHVEVGEPQLAADALVHHRRDDRAPDRQPGHGHAQPATAPARPRVIA